MPAESNDFEHAHRRHSMLRFITLGPDGGNHAYVLRNYLELHGLRCTAHIAFVDDFHLGAAAVARGEAHYMLQCAAHPDFAAVTGRHRLQVVPVDAFVAASQPMALVRLRGPGQARTVAVQPATRQYADLSSYAEVREMPTVSAVQQVLLDGQVDAGIVFARLLHEQEDRLELLQELGSVRDAWVLFGRELAHASETDAWLDSPVARHFAQITPGILQSRLRAAPTPATAISVMPASAIGEGVSAQTSAPSAPDQIKKL